MLKRAAQPQSVPRIALVDLARGLALIAMTVFHFCWDLAMFRLIEPSVMASAGMVWFARSIAGSFLFLVGFSLYLAHHRHIRWQSFAKRWVKIVGAAALITIATWFATPDAFIFFGILHAIALASLLGLPFLALPAWVTGIAGIFFLTGNLWLRTAGLDDPVWWWTGLSSFVPISNDYVPVFPFFGMVLLGIAVAKFTGTQGWWTVMARPELDGRPVRLMRFIGRHSLVYYLLHQPVMIGIMYGILWLSGNI